MNNGLNPFSGVPDLARRKQVAEAMLAQQLAQLSSSIYARAAGDRLRHPGPHIPAADWQQLAKRSHEAAKAYFVALGIAEFQEDQTP